MGRKEIIGIYVAGHNVEFHCLAKGMAGWRTSDPPWPSGSFSGPAHEQLKSALSLLRPSKRHCFILGIPRSQVFLREVVFEGLTEDEAENAVKLGITLHCHLPPDEIYFDQFAFKREEKTVVLLAYVARKNIEHLLDVFRETGHLNQLRAVIVPEIGLDAMLRRYRLDLPALSLGMQGDRWVVSLHGEENWEGSHFLPLEGVDRAEEALQKLGSTLPEPFSKVLLLPIYKAGPQQNALNNLTKSPCEASKEIKALCSKERWPGWALCTAAAGTSSYLPLSLYGRLRKRPVKLRIKPFPIVAILTGLVLAMATGYYGFQYSSISAKVKRLNQQLVKVEKQLAPFKEKEQRLQALVETATDFDDFLRESPSVLQILKALAERTPSDCYIKSLNLRNNRLRVTAQGKSAIDTMASWRRVPIFSDVRLVSPVTKDRKQNERFTVEITIKTRGDTHK